MPLNRCIECGKVNSLEAHFCQACGIRLSGLPFTCKLYGKTTILTIYGAFVALLGGLLGISASIYYAERYYFSEICSTLFLISLFGIVSFALLAIGLTLTYNKNRR
jgi:hypothetical protein